MGVGGVGSGNQTVDTGTDGPNGPQGTGGAGDSGNSGPQGTDGAGGTGGTGDVGNPGTGEGGLDFGGGDFGLGDSLPTGGETTDETDMASRQLCNTIALRCTEDSAARGQILGSHDDNTRANEGDRADSRLMTDSDTYRADGRTETRHSDLGEAFRGGDRRVIDNLFKSLLGGGREGANPKSTGNPTTTPGTPAQPNPTGTTPMTARGEGNPNPTGTTGTTSNPPLLPGATGRAATLTQPRLDQLGSRIANMPNGEPKTQAQTLETRLRAAIASGNHEEASQIMDQLAAMGIEVGGEESTDDVHEEGDVAEGEGAEGEGEGSGVRSEGGERPTPRLTKTHLTSDNLNAGVLVFSGGDGTNGEGGDHLTRMGTGLRTVLSGKGTDAATRLSTDAAIRGVLDDAPGGDDSSGGGGGSSSSHSGPTIAATDGTRRMEVVDAPGPLGNFAVRDEATGRIYGMYDARLSADVMPGVRDYTRVRTRIGAEAISGSTAASTGELWAGMRC